MSRAEELYLKYNTLFKKSGFVTARRLACFFGQIEGEVGKSMLPKQEDGYYTDITRLRQIFKTPFRNKSDEFVRMYLKNSKKLLNYVYAYRDGNRSEESGDGYKYSGKGIIQLSMRKQYEKCSIETGIDFINHPELLLTEANSLIAAIWYWNANNLSKYADVWSVDNEKPIDSISDIVNIGTKTTKIGDAHGYHARLASTKRHLEIFKKILGK